RWELLSSPPEHVIAYDLTGSTAATAEATTVASGIVPFELALGPGVNLAGLADGLSSNGWARGENASRETALNSGDYFEFGFAVEEGYRAALSLLEVSKRGWAINAPMCYERQCSFDGCATPGVTIRPAGPIWEILGWTEEHFR